MSDKKQGKNDKNIGDIIQKMVRGFGWEKRMKELEVIQAWPEIMGKGVAYRTEEIFIRNKVLHLRLNSSVMRDELRFGRSIIIRKVNDYAGFEMIQDIWFE